MDEVLLMRRAQEPNLGLWSPPGGKLKMQIGESPYSCACREAQEEAALYIKPTDLHLNGLVSEHGYEGQAHWLMFLFEVKPKLNCVPPPHSEGWFSYFGRSALIDLPIPQTDQEQIWPLFWKYRGGFFSAHCICNSNGQNVWEIEESWMPVALNIGI